MPTDAVRCLLGLVVVYGECSFLKRLPLGVYIYYSKKTSVLQSHANVCDAELRKTGGCSGTQLFRTHAKSGIYKKMRGKNKKSCKKRGKKGKNPEMNNNVINTVGSFTARRFAHMRNADVS